VEVEVGFLSGRVRAYSSSINGVIYSEKLPLHVLITISGNQRCLPGSFQALIDERVVP